MQAAENGRLCPVFGLYTHFSTSGDLLSPSELKGFQICSRTLQNQKCALLTLYVESLRVVVIH